MNPFKVPVTEYTDHYDLARYSLAWRVSMFMSIVLSILAVMLMSLNQDVFYPTLVGVAAVIGFLLVLYRTRKYGFVAIIFCLLGTVLCQFTLIYFTEEFHMVDVMWILIITLYTFFMLGRSWGVLVLALNTLGIFYYVFACLNLNLSSIGTLEFGHIVGLAINFLVCSTLIGFLILQFLKVIRKAENDLRTVNDELKSQNAMVAVQNQEKTVMLREIHHRVKNNLQVITSLLRLQSDEIEDDESKTKFNETIDRVRSIAHIHERMYLSENLSKIDLEGYIDSLTEDLIHSYQVKKSITLEVDCELNHVHPKSLVSIALIFNELISNSLKHAFPQIDVPAINIQIKFQGDETVSINYRDNGIWKKRSKKSFGMELIESLTEQLNGTFEIEKKNGTHFNFQFDRASIMEDQ